MTMADEQSPIAKPSEEQFSMNCTLYDIDASRNIRRACPKLSNQNLDPYTMVQDMVLVDNNHRQLEFVKLIAQEAKIVTLAHSILKFGQIHPVTVIQNPMEGKKYRNVAGQRRYIAVALVEALNRLKESPKLYKEALGILFDVKADGDDDSAMELNFDDFIRVQTDDFNIKIQVANLTLEQAEDISFEENDETLAMTDLDWGYQFDLMLKTINSQTGKNYTLQDIAKKRKKHYQFVRNRTALPYLPTAWKEKLDDGSISITKAIQKALELKRRSEEQKSYNPWVAESVDQASLSPTGTDGAMAVVVEVDDNDFSDALEVDAESNTVQVEGFESVLDDNEQLDAAVLEHQSKEDVDKELEDASKKKTRKPRKTKHKDLRISTADIMRKIIESDRLNKERIIALAEVIRLTFDEAILITEDDVALNS